MNDNPNNNLGEPGPSVTLSQQVEMMRKTEQAQRMFGPPPAPGLAAVPKMQHERLNDAINALYDITFRLNDLKQLIQEGGRRHGESGRLTEKTDPSVSLQGVLASGAGRIDEHRQEMHDLLDSIEALLFS